MFSGLFCRSLCTEPVSSEVMVGLFYFYHFCYRILMLNTNRVERDKRLTCSRLSGQIAFADLAVVMN